MPICNPTIRTVPLNDWRMKVITNRDDRRNLAAQVRNEGWPTADVHADAGPLEAGESAVFRTRLAVTAKDLAADSVLLHCGMIDDEGWIYVNGELAGEAHDWQATPAISIGKFLHAGDNTIAVLVKNNDNRGGLNKGVKVEFVDDPGMPAWKRSAFNGLAQVIVRGGHDTGDIVLEAKSPGLPTSRLVISAVPSPARPVAPPWSAPGRNISTARK